jgi:hypothetical protein
MAITNIKQWGFHGISLSVKVPDGIPNTTPPAVRGHRRDCVPVRHLKIQQEKPKVTRKIWNFYRNINSNIHDNHDSLAAGAVTVLLMNQPVDISGTLEA